MSIRPETLIVVTRPRDEGAETASYFEAKGFQVHLAPVMEICYRPYDQSILKQYDGFVVTSQQALKALGDNHGCHGKILYAFGEKTLSLAQAMGFEVYELSGHDMQEALPDLIARLKRRPGRYCYLRGADISVDLKTVCAEAQILLDDLILYDAKALEDQIVLPEAQHYAFLLFSERSAKKVLRSIQSLKMKNVTYFCLSEKIKNSIDEGDPSFKDSAFAPKIPTTKHLYDLILSSLI
ncbi:MAG: uroporphyrinogen-III synthase [Alphaproteobacteria bacterium]|nr:uroporphyrinogen-III synthase [Alphaproteobacteria bacterium]MBP9877651.1 uroporphyrinogen-III synthase [Alphaproteobacteria bacterium]